MSRSVGVNTTAIKRVFQSCVFKPTEPGPMKIIADVGNPTYYRQRVCEMLKQIDDQCTDESPLDVMRQCISILALAVAETELKKRQS